MTVIEFHDKILAPTLRSRGLPSPVLLDYHREALDAWERGQVGIESCNKAGKTRLEALVALAGIYSGDVGQIVSYPGMTQLKLQFFGELSKLVGVFSALPVDWGWSMVLSGLSPMFRAGPDSWVVGLSPAKGEAQGEFQDRMLGFSHPGNLRIIAGEAPVFPSWRWTAMRRMQPIRIWAAGNPVDEQGWHHQWCEKLPAGQHLTWPASRVIADQQKAGVTIPGLATQEWVDEFTRDFEGTPSYYSAVLGVCPPASADGVVALADLLACAAIEPVQDNRFCLGVDVAGREETGDYTACYSLAGGVCRREFKRRGMTIPEIAGEVRRVIAMRNAELWRRVVWRVTIDDTGIGGGLTDVLKGEPDVEVVPFKFGGAAVDSTTFHDCATEAYWAVRVLARDRKVRFEFDTQAQAQLTGRKLDQDARGRLALESKDTYKARHGGRSPDDADAIALACWQGERVAMPFMLRL